MSETEPEVVVSMWALMVSWNTPTVLFCVLNIMIGTIFISSKFKSQNNTDRDFEQRGDEQNLPQLIQRVPSLLLQRVRSINFSLYKSQNQPHETQLITEPPPANQNNSDHDHDLDHHHVIRTKSDTSGVTPVKIPAKMKKSASEKPMFFLGVGDDDEKVEEVERRRPATVRERKGKGIETAPVGEDEGVDAKADDFISSFRQQLKLQRLASLVRYADKLKRGF